MKGKDELEGTRNNFTPWLCNFEHQGENRWGGWYNPPLGELGLTFTALKLHVWGTSKPDENQADKWPFQMKSTLVAFLSTKCNMIN